MPLLSPQTQHLGFCCTRPFLTSRPNAFCWQNHLPWTNVGRLRPLLKTCLQPMLFEAQQEWGVSRMWWWWRGALWLSLSSSQPTQGRASHLLPASPTLPGSWPA